MFPCFFRKRKTTKDLLYVNYTKIAEENAAEDGTDIPNSINGSMMFIDSELVAYTEQEEVSASSEAEPTIDSSGSLSEASESGDSGEVGKMEEVQVAGPSTSEHVGAGGSKLKLNTPLDDEAQEAFMESLNRAYFPVMVRDHHPEAPPVESFTPFFPPHTRPRNFSAIYIPPVE